MKRFRITIVGSAKLLLLSSMIGYLMLLSLFSMGCERLAVAGLTVSYGGVSPTTSISPVSSSISPRSSSNSRVPSSNSSVSSSNSSVSSRNSLVFSRKCPVSSCNNSVSSSNSSVSSNNSRVPSSNNSVSSSNSPVWECNSHCGCLESSWDPVCGDNGVTYPSACHAGCRAANVSDKSTVYYECSCVVSPGSGSRSAGAGLCSRGRSCSRRFLYFVVTSVVTSFTLSVGGTPGYFLLLRSARPELKAFSLGIYTLAIRVLAGVPAPVYFGALIDSACMKWASRKCRGRGSCRLYNTDHFRFVYLGVTVALGLVFIFFSSLVLFLLRRRSLPKGSHTSCVELKCPAPPLNLGGDILQDMYWRQKETHL